MNVITAPGPEKALEEGLWWLHVNGEVHNSRNGRVLRSRGPVVTEYRAPVACRVMFNPLRDANPFFHLFESIWMLAGRNDVAPLTLYAKQMATFSDNLRTLNGAYGYRWRNWFNRDQLITAARMLREDPTTRRVVVGMWDAEQDLDSKSKDIPCNTHIYFNAVGGKLDMTVCNRSNDVVWGAYGANAVHMSFLLEFMALAAGLEVGTYYQFSNDYHVYVDRPDVQRLYTRPSDDPCTWTPCFTTTHRAVSTVPLCDFTKPSFGEVATFLVECNAAADHPQLYTGPSVFLREVLRPMCTAHALWTTQHDIDGALRVMNTVLAEDWRQAGQEWLLRRVQQKPVAETRA